MRLPTLNIDARLNTRTLQRDAQQANRTLQQVGGRILSAGGGLGARLGSFGSLGGGLGQLALGSGGLLVAALAPFKAAQVINQAFVDSVSQSKKALDAWSTSAVEGARSGIGLPIAERLALAEARAASAEGAFSGFGAAFFGAATDTQGELTGAVGAAATWAEEVGRGTKQLLAGFGALLSGKSLAEAEVLGIMAAEPEDAERLRAYLAEVSSGKGLHETETDDEMRARVRARSRELDNITRMQMQQMQELLG